MKKATIETCPTCGADFVLRCRCPIGDCTCANGHSWHRCPVHHTLVPGNGNHGAPIGKKCECNKPTYKSTQ